MAVLEAASSAAAVKELGLGTITREVPVGGGCISRTLRLETSSGTTVFLKKNRPALGAMFRGEAAGLEALASEEGPRVPRVLALGDPASGSDREAFILLEYVETGTSRRGSLRAFGQQLARLHRGRRQELCGFSRDNYIGSTEQKNGEMADWMGFFVERRLGFQLALAKKQGLASSRMVESVQRVMAQLPDILIPPDQGRPSVLHGDLWGGNYMMDSQGEAVLIDPAVYFGHREADLAMTRLFGGFGSDFYRGYEEEWPLAPGFDRRCGVYNLYHMLNHLNLFGGSYGSSVLSLCQPFL